MNDTFKKYEKVKRFTTPLIGWIISITLEVLNIYKRWLLWVIFFVKKFFIDVFHSDSDWIFKISSIISFLLVSYLFILIPIYSIFSWWKFYYRDFNIVYGEHQLPLKTDIERDVDIFAQEYSKSFWIDCEWFKHHDVDIQMYEKYKKLYRWSYECAKFSQENRLKIFPISIWSIQSNDKIISLNVKFWKIYYSDSWATQYTTVDSKLWRLKDEAQVLRIDRMKNIQRHDFK